MDTPPPWHQANVTFPDWASAEHTALTHLVPLLRTAEDEGAISAWFFIRKSPCWRIRFQPSTGADARIGRELDALTTAGHITGWTKVVYEPEVHAFGGLEAMAAAHRFFHRDSRGLLAYLHDVDSAAAGHRREMSLMLCSILLRSAGLDWYEQGDVWARVAAHRELPPSSQGLDRLQTAVHRLITVNAEEQMRGDGPLAPTAGWTLAYAEAGQKLAHLAASGTLHRGLRDVLAHHVIFAWNRIGLPYATQAALAATAKAVIFGPDPTVPTSTQPPGTGLSAPFHPTPQGTSWTRTAP